MLERFSFVSGVKEYSTGNSFLKEMPNEVPDIVFMDIKMPDMDGITATKLATKKHLGIKIIALTMFSDAKYLYAMVAAGAKGFLLKDSSEDEIRQAIETVLKNQLYYTQRVLENN